MGSGRRGKRGREMLVFFLGKRGTKQAKTEERVAEEGEDVC